MRRARHAVPFWLRSSAGRLHAVAMLRVLLRLPALPPFPSLSSRLLPAMKRKLATPIAPESAAKRTRSATSKAAAGSLNNFVSSSTSGASPPTTKRKPATTPKSISKKIRSAAAKATTGNLNNFVKSSKATKSSLRSPASTPPPPPAIPPEEYDAPLLLPFYPSRVISNTRIRTYASGERPTPLVALQTKISATALERKRIEPAQFVVNWFRTDLRVPDNTSLHTAAQRGSVIGLYVWCPEDLDAHSVSPAKIDFMLRSLAVLREDLEKLDIPLWVETVERREDVPTRVVQLTEAWGARHVFANMEYEVDELRRDTECVQLGIDSGVAVEMLHDTCVVPPGILVTKSTAKPFAVYTPWYKAWLKHLSTHQNYFTPHPSPPANKTCPPSDLFNSPLPTAPAHLSLTFDEQSTQHSLFPAGSHEALSRLTRFLSKKAHSYDITRDFPGQPGTSVLSPHFASGTLSVRTAVSHTCAANNSMLDGGNRGLDVFISELAWRDFYRQILAAHPHVCMSAPFKLEYAAVPWVHGDEADRRLAAWADGVTGYPLVDAGMRQLRAHKWMHNRVRMVVASFLCKDLLVDWRRGERHFHELLVDGDFANNNGGWGWCAGAGTDAQPYFRIFNPRAQAEKYDPDGDYIRTWIPELEHVRGNEIWEPSPATREKTGYPHMIVEHATARKEAIEAYKLGIARGKATLEALS